MNLPPELPSGLRDVLEYLNGRPRPTGDCYRCWQVGKVARATVVAAFNEGTEHEQRLPCCDACADPASCAHIPVAARPRVVMRLVA